MPQFAHLYNGDDIWVVMKVKRVNTHRAFKDHQPVPGVSVATCRRPQTYMPLKDAEVLQVTALGT